MSPLLVIKVTNNNNNNNNLLLLVVSYSSRGTCAAPSQWSGSLSRGSRTTRSFPRHAARSRPASGSRCPARAARRAAAELQEDQEDQTKSRHNQPPVACACGSLGGLPATTFRVKARGDNQIGSFLASSRNNTSELHECETTRTKAFSWA
ncbi:hypothetical protein EYF80_030786 [Liparis tanakae]|uniref:Uncharacterized protein n=1 Tax=Liparis tanakae TaxID=230148 RepID=A0A4Z2GZL3_9TELE|nr:hypothetical protein EYF80_030786 [Liparis tanakae]